MSFCIMNIQKRKKNDVGGIHAEANRKIEDREKNFKNSSIDWNFTQNNLFLKESKNLRADIDKEIKEYASDALVRSNSVMMCDVVFSASSDFFEQCFCDGEDLFYEKADAYFKDCLRFAEAEFGHVVNAVVHYDETTPHMHLQFVPITKDGRLSAKEVLGNRKEYSERQDRFYESVGKKWQLERGIRKSTEETRKHLTVAEFKAQTLENAINKFAVTIEEDIKVTYKKELTYLEFKKAFEHFTDAVKCFLQETEPARQKGNTSAEGTKELLTIFKQIAAERKAVRSTAKSR